MATTKPSPWLSVSDLSKSPSPPQLKSSGIPQPKRGRNSLSISSTVPVIAFSPSPNTNSVKPSPSASDTSLVSSKAASRPGSSGSNATSPNMRSSVGLPSMRAFRDRFSFSKSPNSGKRLTLLPFGPKSPSGPKSPTYGRRSMDSVTISGRTLDLDVMVLDVVPEASRHSLDTVQVSTGTGSPTLTIPSKLDHEYESLTAAALPPPPERGGRQVQDLTYSPTPSSDFAYPPSGQQGVRGSASSLSLSSGVSPISQQSGSGYGSITSGGFLSPGPLDERGRFDYLSSAPGSSYPSGPGSTVSNKTSNISTSALVKSKSSPGGGSSTSRSPSAQSTMERGLLGELARQLQRVTEQQSTVSLVRPQTPSSVLNLAMAASAPTNDPSESPADFNSPNLWNIDEMKSAMARMQLMIEEQEKRGPTPSLSPDVDLHTVPPPAPGLPPLPQPKSAVPSKMVNHHSHQKAAQSFDFKSLDPDLVAILTPNHLSVPPSNPEFAASLPSSDLILPVASTSSELAAGEDSSPQSSLPAGSPMEWKYPPRPQAPAPESIDSPVEGVASDLSVEDILLGKNAASGPDSIDEEDSFRYAPKSTLTSLSPVAESSPRKHPRKGILQHALPGMPRSSSLSLPRPKGLGIPSPPRMLRSPRNVAAETMDSPGDSSPGGGASDSPASVSASPKRKGNSSPLSRLKGKDRPPLPSFDPTDGVGSAIRKGSGSLKRLLSSSTSIPPRSSLTPSPTPPPRSGSATGMLTSRRPKASEGYSGRRSVTLGAPSPRRISLDETGLNQRGFEGPTASSIRDGRPSLDIGPRTARAFAAAGVLDSGGKVSSWRNEGSVARSSNGSPVPPGIPASGRYSAMDMREGNWSRTGFRTPDPGLGRSNSVGMDSSSPTSSAHARTVISSSASSGLLPGTMTTASHQAAVQLLKERHELETEALLTALGESKKLHRRAMEENEDIKAEMREMGNYIDNLEEQLGEAAAKNRWMEMEIDRLKASLSAARRPSPSSVRGGPSPTHFVEDGKLSGQWKPQSRPSSATLYRPADYNASIIVTPARSSPQRHHRQASETSSTGVPDMGDSMSMLLNETPGLSNSGFDGASLYSNHNGSGSPPPSPTLVLRKHAEYRDTPILGTSGKQNLSPPSSSRGLAQTPARQNSKTQRYSALMELSPTTTTADYSFTPGSPGSLILRPEDEMHLGDLASIMGADDSL